MTPTEIITNIARETAFLARVADKGSNDISFCWTMGGMGGDAGEQVADIAAAVAESAARVAELTQAAIAAMRVAEAATCHEATKAAADTVIVAVEPGWANMAADKVADAATQAVDTLVKASANVLFKAEKTY